MDREFRDAFFRDPAVASEAAGISLTNREWDALTRIRPGALAAFERYLHAKRLDNEESGDEEQKDPGGCDRCGLARCLSARRLGRRGQFRAGHWPGQVQRASAEWTRVL